MSKIQLSQYQTDIIDAFKKTHDNMFISALAGCGKTFILTELSQYVDTYSVFIAFNKSIQEELKTRITNPKFKTYTFNGLGYQIMSNNWEKMENERLKNQPNTKRKNIQLDSYKTKTMLSKIWSKYEEEINVLCFDEEDDNIMRESIATLFDLCRQRMVNINDEDSVLMVIEFYELFHGVSVPECICKFLNDLMLLDMQLFKEEGIVDFIDQIFLTYILVKNGEWVLEYWHRFENIFLDEAQDVSTLQQLFIGILRRSKNSRIIAVGDKNQAIYSFAGADCRAVDSLQRLYKTVEYELPVNYRCPAKHLRYVQRECNIPIKARPNAPEGHLYNIDYDEIFDYIQAGDCILARKNSDLCQIILELLQQGIPVYIRDEKLVNRLIAQINSAKKEINDMNNFPEYIENIRDKYKKAVIERTKKLQNEGVMDNTEVENMNFSDTNVDLLDCLELLYRNYCSDYKTNLKKLNDFDCFSRYVRNMLKTDGTKDSIQCVSIHQAKGKEYNRVFILNNARVHYELASNPDQTQQEKNLSYIALTRSKDILFLVNSPPDDDDYDMEMLF